MIKRKVISTMFLIGILAASNWIYSLRVAQAATCSGNACSGQNPNSTGCDANASTIAQLYVSVPNGGGTYYYELVEVRKSNICTTKWAKTTNLESSFPTYRYLRSELQTSGGSVQWSQNGAGNQLAQVYTLQQYAPSTCYKAFGRVTPNSNYTGGQTGTTSCA